MNNIKVFSEIGKLKAVLLHEPGEELLNLTPQRLDDLLFDDIPWLPLAIEEHKAFAKTFIDAGVKVYYLVDLMVDVLKDNDIKNEFVNQFMDESGIYSETLKAKCVVYLNSFADVRKLILKCISGIKKTDLPNYSLRTLSDYVDDYLFITDPMPNLYFTRDPFASIGCGASLHKMYSVTRNRETIFSEYLFKYHPLFKETNLYYDRYKRGNIEGGDIMVLNKDTLIIGVSQRTSSEAIESLAKSLFWKNETTFKQVLVFTIPKFRTFMHLDTVFTQVDKYKFTIHKGCYDKLEIYELTKDLSREGKLIVKPLDGKLENVLEKYLNHEVLLIPCGGDDSINADREQWSDGSNCVAIGPGEVITYERNEITNKVLEENGVIVHKIPSSELSRGRGGPRCMCMPLLREEI